MTKQKLEQIRDAIFILSNLSNEDWEELYGMIENPNWVSKVSETRVKAQGSMEEKLIDLLKNLCIPFANKGYHYLYSAIKLFICAENPEKILMTKELYPVLAKDFNTTPHKVEAAIRHSIEIACDRRYSNNEKLLKEIFGDMTKFKTGKPSNSEFIATVAEYLKVN